jgi:hypothetical protein
MVSRARHYLSSYDSNLLKVVIAFELCLYAVKRASISYAVLIQSKKYRQIWRKIIYFGDAKVLKSLLFIKIFSIDTFLLLIAIAFDFSFYFNQEVDTMKIIWNIADFHNQFVLFFSSNIYLCILHFATKQHRQLRSQITKFKTKTGIEVLCVLNTEIRLFVEEGSKLFAVVNLFAITVHFTSIFSEVSYALDFMRTLN